MPLAAGTPGGAPTSRDGLTQTIAALERRLADEPGNGVAAARLADALLRQARATGNGGLAIQAEERAARRDRRPVPATKRSGCSARCCVSQHRFRDAIAAAEQARAIEPADAWNDGVIGDAHLELGEYDAAFAAFDAMMRKRPSAAAYGRASYARELQGDLDGALRLMQMALDATSAHDPESQAWHYAQLGDLQFQRGHLADAEREYRHALFTFADHPLALAGLARVDAARGDLAGGAGRLRDARGVRGDAGVRGAHGRDRTGARAARSTRRGTSRWPSRAGATTCRSRRSWRGCWRATARRAAEALAIAEQAAASRQDIFTMDAVAWAAFRAGDLTRAVEASRLALRTGTRDRTLLYHAAAIAAASGDRARARTLVDAGARRASDVRPRARARRAGAAARRSEAPAGSIARSSRRPSSMRAVVDISPADPVALARRSPSPASRCWCRRPRRRCARTTCASRTRR